MSKITPSGLFLKKSPVFESLFVVVSALFFTLPIWFVVVVAAIVLSSCLVCTCKGTKIVPKKQLFCPFSSAQILVGITQTTMCCENGSPDKSAALSRKNAVAGVINFCYLCVLGDCKAENCVKP